MELRVLEGWPEEGRLLGDKPETAGPGPGLRTEARAAGRHRGAEASEVANWLGSLGQRGNPFSGITGTRSPHASKVGVKRSHVAVG